MKLCLSTNTSLWSCIVSELLPNNELFVGIVSLRAANAARRAISSSSGGGGDGGAADISLLDMYLA